MANRFDAWLRTAPPGSTYTYHSGPHLSKKNTGIDFTSLVYSAREAYDRGEVILVQKRITHPAYRMDAGTFAWLAVKREHVVEPEAWISIDGEVVKWRERPLQMAA